MLYYVEWYIYEAMQKRGRARPRYGTYETQLDFLTKKLLSRNTKKVKAVGSQSNVEFDYEEEANYLNNQGGFEAIAKRIKDKRTMIKLVREIVTKGIRKIKMIGVDCMCLLQNRDNATTVWIKSLWGT